MKRFDKTIKRIATVTITEPEAGQWKLTIMSLSEPRETLHYHDVADLLNDLQRIMVARDWEQLG